MKLKTTPALAAVRRCLRRCRPRARRRPCAIANQGDALSMDPHSLNESLQLSVTGNVYEPLVGRNKDLSSRRRWPPPGSRPRPTVWRFELRKDVQFHDGTPFTADDVVFCYERAAGRRLRHEELRQRHQGNAQGQRPRDRHRDHRRRSRSCRTVVHARSHHEQEVVRGPTRPPARWTAARASRTPPRSAPTAPAPSALRERQPNVRTTFVRNGNYWGKIEGNVAGGDLHPDRQRRHPRGRAAVRRDRRDGAGAGAGHRAHQRARPTPRCCAAPSCAPSSWAWTRSATSCCISSVKGKNPFKDKRVRQAFYQAIDIEGIKRTVMRGASTPDRPDGRPRRQRLRSRSMNKRLPYDAEAAKKLLADAGYPQRLRSDDELPERPLRQRRADLPGGGGQPGAHRRQDQPGGRNQGHLLPQDPAPRHQLLPAGLDAQHATTRTTRSMR